MKKFSIKEWLKYNQVETEQKAYHDRSIPLDVKIAFIGIILALIFWTLVLWR